MAPKRRSQLPMAGMAERHRIGCIALGSFAFLGFDLTLMMENLRLQLLERMVMRSKISVIVSGMPGCSSETGPAPVPSAEFPGVDDSRLPLFPYRRRRHAQW